MTISVTRSNAYTTSDNTQHPSREAALLHEKFLVRQANVAAIKFSGDPSTGVATSDEGVQVVAVANLPKFLASHADLLLAALTVKQTRSAPAPKAAA